MMVRQTANCTINYSMSTRKINYSAFIANGTFLSPLLTPFSFLLAKLTFLHLSIVTSIDDHVYEFGGMKLMFVVAQACSRFM